MPIARDLYVFHTVIKIQIAQNDGQIKFLFPGSSCLSLINYGLYVSCAISPTLTYICKLQTTN